MTENEIALIKMIRESNDSDTALITAIEVICEFLNHPEPSVLKPSADFQAEAETVQA